MVVLLVDAEATVLALHDGAFEASEEVHAGRARFDAGPSAAVRLDTGQTVILTSRPIMPLSIAQLTVFGLKLSPLPGYRPHVTDVIHVDTPGVTAADLGRFTYRHRRVPMYPFEPETVYPSQALRGGATWP